MKFGYFFDETGNCHIHNEEAAVVRFVFKHYVNEHPPIIPIDLFIAAQARRWRLTSPDSRARTKNI